MGATEHVVQCFIGVILPGCDIKNANSNGGILKNRAKEPFACPQSFLRTSAFGNVFAQPDDIMRPARGIPDQLEPVATDDDAAVASYVALYPFILVTPTLNE